MTPTDPLYANQWYLQLLGDLETLWDDYSGNGVAVAVYDDGVDTNHEDLDDNYDANAEITVGGMPVAGDPVSAFDGHGTAVAGIIAAEMNGTGVVGIAHGSTLTSVPYLTNINVGADAIEALSQLRNFDVANHSWGNDTPYFRTQSEDDEVAEFVDAMVNGRGGLGSINVHASGNVNQNANVELLGAGRATLSVAAYDDTGDTADYSNYGANVLISAPSSGGNEGQTTTDVTGTGGYDNGNYTNTFGGTSGAAPVVAGVVALMLEANPNLGWRDVYSILAYSAKEVGSGVGGMQTADEDNTWFENAANNWNGGGLHYSEDYGYGAIDAYNAVRMAEVWSRFYDAATSQNEDSRTVTDNSTQALADFDTDSYFVELPDAAHFVVEYAEVTINIDHAYFGDVQIEVISPDGTVTQAKKTDDSLAGTGGTLTWTFGLNAFRGEIADGTWEVRFTDNLAPDGGTLQGVTLEVFGKADPGTKDVFHFTDEFAESLARDGSRGSIDGGNGEDWLNAAAVTSGSVIDLDAGEGEIDGAMLTITEIENVITGDGDDVIRMSDNGDRAWGERGDDFIRGGNADDIMRGGLGRDTLAGDNGDDRMLGGVAQDIMRGNSGDDRMFGQNGKDVIKGGAGDDYGRGGTGRDTMDGGRGNDLLEGGGHNDALFGGRDDDTLDGGRGNDSLAGEQGADVFRFGDDFGRDSVLGFEDGIDRIDFSTNSTINALSDIIITADGANALITDQADPTNVVTLFGSAGLISAADIDFV
ncbi:MAG: S8 family serine peptidase [Pseudomonadota bacterium]